MNLIEGLLLGMFMLPMVGIGFAIIDDMMLDNVIGEHLTKKLKKKLEGKE